MYFVPKDFELFELLPRDYYRKYYPRYGEQLWMHFPQPALWTIQALREKYGKVYINTWYWGGAIEYRGWRPEDCAFGADLSFHKQYLAFDLDFQEESNRQVQEDILHLPAEKDPAKSTAFQHITCMEVGTPHVHIDFRNWGPELFVIHA